MNLRPYQAETVRKALRWQDLGIKSVCIVMPTGGGKTVTGSFLALQAAAKRGGGVLWLAHRKELVRQAAKSLCKYVPAAQVGIIAPWAKRSPGARVQVGSIQTVRLLEHLPQASVVVFDEVHHMAGDNEWAKLVRTCAKQGAFLVGLTATPERKDGAGLYPQFRKLLVAAKTSELIRQGHLVPAEVMVPPRVITDGIADVPVKLWEKYAPGTRTVVFCSSVDHAIATSQEFTARGHRSAWIEGDMRAKERDRILHLFETGKIRVICNCQILTEGFDMPAIETVLLARTVGSHALYLQMVGRGLRPSAGKRLLKVLDATGSSKLYGHPNLDRTYSLQGKPIVLDEKKASRQKTCSNCGLLMSMRTAVCPSCGVKPKAMPRKPKKVYSDRLERMSVKQQADIQTWYYSRSLDRARSLGLPDPSGYARDLYFKKFNKRWEG